MNRHIKTTGYSTALDYSMYKQNQQPRKCTRHGHLLCTTSTIVFLTLPFHYAATLISPITTDIPQIAGSTDPVWGQNGTGDRREEAQAHR